MADLQAMTALGAHAAAVVTIGPLTITERTDVALASLAVRQGRMTDFAAAARAAGVPLPEPALHRTDATYAAFWVAPGMWFVEAPYTTHEPIADLLKSAFGATASVTEQTDAWVVFDLATQGPSAREFAPVSLTPLLERLCNVDFAAVSPGHATRTVIDHLGCYLIKHGPGAARLYGPRSSAQSLLHALEVVAASAW